MKSNCVKAICLCALVTMIGMHATRVASQETAVTGRKASFKVLVFSRTLGYRHASITNGIAALRALGGDHGFAVDATEDSSAFTQGNLERYAAVVFLSATGDVLNTQQEAALKAYVLGGGGFVGIHGAVFGPLACEDKWDWFGEMFCCAFKNHSAVVPAVVHLEDAGHAANAGLPARWERTEEWYNFTGTPRGCARVLATVDESTYKGGTMGADHPIAWCKPVGKGRMWYTAMGHTESSFDEPLFRKHLLQGVLIAAGRRGADFSVNAAPASVWAWNRGAGMLALEKGTNVVWQFNYGANESKPCFHPVAVPGGPVLTWNQPSDHRWHHALWFSWKYINGTNYWETEGLPLAERGLTEWGKPHIEVRPDFSARIVMDLAYRLPNGPPLLTEHRILEVSAPQADKTYRLDWSMRFTAGENEVLLDRTPLPGEPGGQSWGGYAGLSVRFAQEIKEPRGLAPEGPIEFAEGKYRGRASAMDYTGVFGGQEAGIAILDYPANLNSPTPWYAIREGTMHYFSPAVIQEKAFRLAAGQSIALRYRVVVHPGRWDAERLRGEVPSFAAQKLETAATRDP